MTAPSSPPTTKRTTKQPSHFKFSFFSHHGTTQINIPHHQLPSATPSTHTPVCTAFILIYILIRATSQQVTNPLTRHDGVQRNPQVVARAAKSAADTKKAPCDRQQGRLEVSQSSERRYRRRRHSDGALGKQSSLAEGRSCKRRYSYSTNSSDGTTSSVRLARC